ncbi:hypothetical protein PR002_g4142 [Phytophthora rubi]|uniref:Uncharacterized protein n=1 Tax=Phytophthora rubi TaxID=129364 RepID=A0A6A3NIF9_9STRA|nr:hypothetical protein PR002_g4142 [Phytophthora rubi]
MGSVVSSDQWGRKNGRRYATPDSRYGLAQPKQPSVWYTTSAAGRVKAKDLMRVSPQAILEAFQTPLPHRQNPPVCTDDVVAVRHLSFEANTLFPQHLQVFCRDMASPTICLPTELTPKNNSNSAQSGLTKGVFCLQRYIPCQNNASFLVVWRHSHVRDNCEKATSPVPGDRGSTHKSTGASKRLTPRAHSDVFLLTQVAVDVERGANDNSGDSVITSENEATHTSMQSARRLTHLDIESPDNCTAKALRQSGFDVGVMAPLLFYMKRVTSEIANRINLGRNTQQACGLALGHRSTILGSFA